MSSSSKDLIKRANSKAKLRLGTGLSGAMAALLLLAPGMALADDCGTPVAGVITCPSTGNPFSGGITYALPVGDPVQDLTLALNPGVVIDTSGTTNKGITVVNGTGGKISISGAASTIRTNGDRADGVFALSSAENAKGDIDVHVGDVSTGGYRSDGIYASTNQGGNTGNITVSAGNIAVSGAGSFGINVSAYSGDVNVDVGSVTTIGEGDQAIWATSGYGNVSVNAGTVDVSGATGRGISAYSAGTTVVTGGDVTTRGQGVPFGGDSDGVMAVGTKVVVDISGTVSTSGDYAVGVYAHTNHVQNDPMIGNPDIDVTVGHVDTKGLGSDGIHAVNTAYNGDTKVTVGSVSTQGDYAWGIYAASYHHNTAVTAGSVTTSGNNGTGIIALANGFVNVTADSVTTSGDNAEGIQTISGAATSLTGTTIDVSSVSTSGANSAGIDAKSYYQGSTIAIDAGIVSTRGDMSDGISASGAGSIAITTNGVTTTGAQSAGIYAIALPGYNGQPLGNITVIADNVSTSGTGSAGIATYAGIPLMGVSITTNHLATTGDYADGIYAIARSGNIKINASDVKTSGSYATGVLAASTYGDVSVHANGVTVSGQGGNGIVAGANGGHVSVTANNVSSATGRAIYAFGSSVDITTTGTITGGYQGIYAVTTDGDIVLHNDAAVSGDVDLLVLDGRADLVVDGHGSITTSYNGDSALRALNATGGNVSITQGTITTSGSYARGIVASVNHGVQVAGQAPATPNITLDVQNVTTSGYGASAILINNNASGGDAVATVHGTVSTAGHLARGVQVYSANGMAGVQLNAVKTQGSFADAIHLDGKTVLANVTGPISTQGNLSIGIAAYGGNGGIKIANGGSISTTGLYGTGIRASAPGDITITGTGSIATTGADSVGIEATEVRRHRELYSYVPSFGIDPRVNEPPVTGSTIAIAANAVTTAGDRSDGIFASASTGAVKITTNSVAVTGVDSVGIFAEDKAVSADTGNTFSAKSTAIELRGFDSANLNVRGLASSDNGNAVELQGSNVTLTVAAGGSIQGATNGVVIDATPHVTPVVSYWGHAPNGYYAPVQPIQPVNPAPGKVTVTNAGTIGAGTGYAITVTGGSAKVTNSGLIRGRVLFSAGDDVLVNPGTFDAIGDTDFGAGTDLFQNSGTVRVLPGTTTAGHVSFLGLERFENSGLIDLRNGHSGDTLTLAGNFAGSGASALGLDLTFDTTVTADQLIVGGAATGTTLIKLNITNPSAATLSSTPVILVRTGAGSAAGAFTLANPDIGLIRYGLAFNAASGTFGLTGNAGAPVYRTLKIGEGAGNIWNRATDGWEAHLADGRDTRGGGSGEGRKIWGQIFGGVDTRDENRSVATPGSGTANYDLGYRQTYYGAQIGVDLAEGENSVFGVTGSYVSSEQQGHGSADRSKFETVSLGGYVGFHAGPFFASALAQYGHDWVTASNEQLGWKDKLKGDLYGAAVQVGVRFGSEKVYAEPLASLSYLHTDISDLHALGQTIAFDGATGLRGKLGARLGASFDLKGGGKALFYATGNAVHEFKGDNGATFLSGGGSATLGNQRIATYGQGSVGVNFVSAGKLSGFIEADGNIGGEFKGAGGRAGISLKF
ncbi:autotransporter outer membrane beta-barrel domain-containing protein [Sphingomonas sp. AR_OL41]|uniref:autotransporter outer membrane beta-barrel domain-containing protein n=1 Tax=Sphingomonas sp. AR_OL41 TaxID=3042729 RepID=UPI00248037AE|nr:autotransporter outer membrane beta-barrel domain-containing protein [Sphingomonas sp. AR_OL41]MDH7975223.1 autotransporter outer membrane beta-barrel domain-containing protein [Sphingomonas sp. AR_OL41]